MTLRHVVLHGHFYQPPRADPWYQEVPRQPSAAPAHDWNARVCEECYAPNTAARLLDGRGRVREFIDNYRSMSFDFGPTLLEWMERHAPDTYASLLDADRDSRERLGYGNAMAQAHGHLIMPLASERDRHTQVIWGIADFAARFGRDPEGMWLPETAVDIATLEALAAHGIRFTVLAPSQASRFRPVDGDWQTVEGAIDGRVPYRAWLPSGDSIDLFFYDGYLSRGVAFEGLLQSGERLTGALLDAFDGNRSEAQLVHVATDGETYGHHHRFGEMALAYAIDALRARDDVRITNYASYLGDHPPRHEVEVRERTSWSCAHGIERWRADCGCHTGGRPGWNQQWRAPLRAALDWLGDALARNFEQRAGELLLSPWRSRDAYVELLLRQPQVDRGEWLRGRLRPGVHGTARALAWLESQHQAMAMFTSCGWFFNDLSGVETEQVLLHAARAVQLARVAGGEDLEPRLLELLRDARSNRASVGTAADLWARNVIPRVGSLGRVAAVAAWLALTGEHRRHLGVYCVTLQQHTGDGEHELRGTVIVSDPRDVTTDEFLVEAGWEGDHLRAVVHVAGGDATPWHAEVIAGVDAGWLQAAVARRGEARVLVEQRRMLARLATMPPDQQSDAASARSATTARAVAEADLCALLDDPRSDAAALAATVAKLQGHSGPTALGTRTAAALREALSVAAQAADPDPGPWTARLLQLARMRRDLAPEVAAWRVQRRVMQELRAGTASTREHESLLQLAELLEVAVPGE